MLNGQMLSVAHVGDSRMYLIRGDMIEPLTTDHSLVAEQVRRGMLTEEEAERSPQKNIITRALGMDDAVDVELDEIPLIQGDQLLLCSDGLTRDVKPAEILATARLEKEPQAAAERLVELANAAGGLDNTTVILVSIQHGARGTSMQRVWNWLIG
jgi:protein phosphatase